MLLNTPHHGYQYLQTQLFNSDNYSFILAQMVKKHHCPKYTKGTIRTLTDLKIYARLLDWDKQAANIMQNMADKAGITLLVSPGVGAQDFPNL